MTILYKYCTPEVARLILETGSIRIGTLFEYQALEGDARVDCGEGKRITTSEPGEVTYQQGSIAHQLLESMGIHVEGSICTNGSNAVVHERQHPDCYVFCASARHGADLYDKFGGACVMVTDYQSFVSQLDCAFRHVLAVEGLTVSQPVVGHCAYGPRAIPFTQTPMAHECFTKPEPYRSEAEIRVLWSPADGHSPSSRVVRIPPAGLFQTCNRSAES